jgi:phage FluMu gp28-like protein
MTSFVIKKTPRDLPAFIGTELGFISTFFTYDGKLVRPEPFQIGFLNNPRRFRSVVKARQVGLSFIIALEALARCHLRDGYTAIVLSFNLADAVEKIHLARQVYEEMPTGLQKKLVTDARTELAFQSNSPGKPISRIISLPSKAPRGRRGDIYMDEAAHHVNCRAVYAGSTALIMRSQGQLTMASTPLGKRGIFWEIATEELRKYPHYSRQWVPWWLSRYLCKDPKQAAIDAPSMSTEERIERFGLPSIREQFDSLPLENFMEEFEDAFLSDSDNLPFPYELILPCTSDDLVIVEDPDELAKPDGRLVAGYDVGRRRDLSVLSVFEIIGGRHYCRLLKVLRNAKFDDQEGLLRRLLMIAPIARLSVDQNGIGMQLAENLSRDYREQVQPEWSTNAAKEMWVTDLKVLMQRRDIVLPKDRRLTSEFHAIKKTVLPSGKVNYDAERTVAGHADRFWSIAMAVQKERGAEPKRAGEVGVRVIG